MACDPETGYIRELQNESELNKGEILFKHGEVINIKGCDFKLIQICGLPHNTITLQSIAKKDVLKELLKEIGQEKTNENKKNI